MLVSALVFERNLRKLGRAGLDQMTQSVRANGMRDPSGLPASGCASASAATTSRPSDDG